MSTIPRVENRTYRSHSQPACLPCRKRKSRCKRDNADAMSCLSCKLHGNDCVFPDTSVAATRPVTSNRRAQKRLVRPGPDLPPLRPRLSASPCPEHTPRDDPAQDVPMRPTIDVPCSRDVPFAGSPAPASPGEDESHVIGPVQSPDAQRIASYLFNDTSFSPRASRMIVARPDQLSAGKRAVLFNAVRRRPLGHAPTQSLPASICEIVTKLLEPYCENLVDIYFSTVHQCFPLLDERAFKLQRATPKGKISPALITSLYAQAIVYWRNSSSTPNQHYPDLRFIWNKANEALHSELYESPGMSAIIAILLNISGRPLTALIGNGVLLGSAISLAHSLGLNRNCLDWNISSSEKLLRTRLWWAIVIVDKWISVTHGTPQQLRASQHDVPPPDLAVIADSGQDTDERATFTTFEALARLSPVIETYLDHVFDLHRPPGSGNARFGLLLEKALAQWEDHLPNGLRRAILRGTNLSIPGSANLRLSYLYIRLLIQKLGIDDIKQNEQVDSEDLEHRLLHARQTAENIVLFVQELNDVALRDFWLYFNAFALSGTVAFLFRCALESEQGVVGLGQSRYLKLAWDLVETLQAHQRRMNWDIGNVCVAQYATILEKLVVTGGQPSEAMSDLQQFCQSEFAEFDQMFPDFWDRFQMESA
ncbi:fungal-specific transcription factor domain-containing protein [Nemania sp. NC0429]|nr:fungal-specific transcription factor domain-containing protein [Nemania sp. NC0429]